MSKPKWHKGAPPSVGWWPASSTQKRELLRYWNGEVWSISCYPWDGALLAGNNAAISCQFQNEIEWTERWWL
jgi:hypothetical protein